jgi:MFS transporter, DHA1 family, tetracycline resistance protein
VEGDVTTGRRLPGLLIAVLAVFTAQQSLAPLQAPLAREVGLSEIALGLVLTAGAAVFAGTSLLWGRAVDRYGHRAVLLAGMLLSLAGMTGFAVVSQVALAGGLDPWATLALMLATRSVFFGAGVGAVPVAAIALVAATTTSEADRTTGIGRIGAVQGLAVALGPALGGALGFAGLLGPLWTAPAVVALALGVVALLVPRTSAVPTTAAGTTPGGPADRSALRPWDPRLWPVLVGGFGLYLALGMTLIVLGFLVQDRLGLDAAATVSATGAASFASGVVLILAQGVVVPRLGWPAARLLRVGSPIALLGLLVLLVANSLGLIVVALVVLAAGLGLAIPGYTTAPTLLVGPDEQGAVAGLVQTVTALTFVVAPVAGTALYGRSPELPVLVAAVACALAALFVRLHPALRPSPARGDRPSGEGVR